MFVQEEKVLDYKFSKKNNTFELFDFVTCYVKMEL